MSTNDVGIVIQSIVAIIVAILGIICTFIQIKKSLTNDIYKQKSELQVNNMSDVCREILYFLDSLSNNKMDNDTLSNEIKNIRDSIFCYGSELANKLFSSICEIQYSGKRDKNTLAYTMALYLLLVSQIRYDVTGEAISPEYWYRASIKDYYKNQSIYQDANNKIVNQYLLNKKFIIQ